MTSKKAILAFIAVSFLIGAIAAATYQYTHPMDATVIDISLERTLDGIVLADDEPIHWGTVEPDTIRTATLGITNTGDTNVIVTVTAEWGTDMTGWELTWEHNGVTLLPTDLISGWLNLTVPADATMGATYNWNCYVNADETAP